MAYLWSAGDIEAADRYLEYVRDLGGRTGYLLDVLAEKDAEPEPRYFINPEILAPSEEMNLHEEGCLSVPDYYDEVERPATCRIKFLDYDGNEQVLEAEGLLATCIQHEMDHLEGILFIDYLSRLKRDRVLKKLRKEQRLAAE